MENAFSPRQKKHIESHNNANNKPVTARRGGGGGGPPKVNNAGPKVNNPGPPKPAAKSPPAPATAAVPADKKSMLQLDIEPILRGPKTSSKQSRGFMVKTPSVFHTSAPGLDVLRRTQFLFFRATTAESSFLREAVNKYQVFNENGKVLYWVKEMEGDGRKFSLGGTFDLILCVLAMDGRELIRCEGNRGKRGSRAVLSVFIGPLFVGDVIQKTGRYSTSLFHVVDDTQKDVAIIKSSRVFNDKGDRCDRNKCRCCCACSGSSSKPSEIQYFNIYLSDTRGLIGTAGKIAKFFPLVSREMDDCFGVELSDAMTNKEKSLLFAFCLLFVQPKPETTMSGNKWTSQQEQQQGDSVVK